MKHKAIIPRNCAVSGLSYEIWPIPSCPASIPMTKNNVSMGKPVRFAVLLTTTLTNNNIETTKRMMVGLTLIKLMYRFLIFVIEAKISIFNFFLFSCFKYKFLYTFAANNIKRFFKSFKRTSTFEEFGMVFEVPHIKHSFLKIQSVTWI